MVQLSEEILSDKTTKLEYFLTYRNSQDHLELFFNAVRRCGEFACCSFSIVLLRDIIQQGVEKVHDQQKI